MPDLQNRLAEALQDRYAIQRELGRGGMATVYLADDLRHHRPVALKILKPELAAALGPERFLHEIEVTARLHHPNILPLYDSGQTSGAAEFLFYVMPFIEGESLRDRLERERQIPVEEALAITRDVAEALSYAHSRGVIHRDIKPENILLESGRALVADFGIAKAVTDAGGQRLTETGLSVGTPAYMSPEQADPSGLVDARSDVYSLGCVLYEMLAGHPPFQGTTAHEMLARHAMDPIPRLKAARTTIPAPIEDAVLRALEKTPADRFATASAFHAALELDPVAYRRRERRRRRLRVLALGTAAALGLVIAGGSVRAILRHRAAAPPELDPAAIPIDSTAIAVLPFRVVGADTTGVAQNLADHMGDLFELKVSAEFGRRIRHPGSVFQQWRSAGGTPDSALPEAAELDVARAVGAGRLVRGTIFVNGDSLIVSAALVEVPGGAVRASTGRVDGTPDRQQDLLDRVITLLLAGEAGMAPERLPRLAQFRPEAVQALIASRRPGTWAQNRAWLRRALELDSNLVEAAFGLYVRGEQVADSAALRYAWDHRDQLTERSRAYLPLVGAGLVGPVQTAAARIDGYADLLRRWPEWGAMWGELATNLTFYGSLSGVPDWERRAQAALERVAGGGLAQSFLIQFALMHEDTAAALRVLERFAKLRPRLAREWPTGLALDAAYAWYLAILRGDSVTAWRLLEADTMFGGELTSLALMQGRGLAQIDRRIARSDYPLPLWGWVRGRTDLWQGHWGDLGGTASPLARAGTRLYWALLLGPEADTTVAPELQLLEMMARGQGELRPSPDEQAVARCWMVLWRLGHRDTTGALALRGFLETQVGRPFRFAGWARLLEAMRTELADGDTHAALLRLDSVLRAVPLTQSLAHTLPSLGEHEVTMPFAEVHNLLAARMLARHGEPARALAAVRRRDQMSLALSLSLPEYLREEGRLAALVGDTAGALRAYRHYLALRADPNPPWRAQWDSVRIEVSRLDRGRG